MFFTDKNRKKNLIFSFTALIFFCGVVFLAQTHAVYAEESGVYATLTGWLSNPFSMALKSLLYGIFVMFGWFASLAVSIFEWAIDPADVQLLFDSQGVLDSWKFVRDFFNLFFILVLLYVAFTVVFQINKDFKKAILSLVLAALFVNFSFPISRMLIDATNVPMYFFANQMMSRTAAQGTGILGGVMTASHIKGILIPEKEALKDIEVSRLFMAIIFMFLFSMTLLVLSVMFVIRLIGLVVLVIFSSVGFVASIVPGMEQYSKMWWENFWKYAIFGPAAMLMLLVATRFFASIGGENSKIMGSMKTVVAGTVTAPEQTFFASMALFSIPIIMLWMAMALAQKMSIAGASSIVGAAEKVSKWMGKAPFRASWAGAKYVDRKVESKLANTKYGKYFSPRVWTNAIKHRSEEQKHRDEQSITQGAGKLHDQLNTAISRFTSPIKSWKAGHGVDHTDHALEEAQKITGEYRKEISDVSNQSDYVIAELKSAIATKNKAKADAAIQILAKNNDLNDMLVALGDEYKEGLKLATDEETGKTIVSSANMLKLLKGLYAKAGENDEELLAKRMMVVSDSATASGNFAFGGMAVFNKNESHKFTVADEDDQAIWAAGKVKNLESQKRQQMLHPDSLFTRTKDGFGDINGKVAKAIIGTFTNADIKQSDRSRDDMKQAIFDAYNKQQPEFMEMYNNPANGIFKKYVDVMVKYKTAPPEQQEA